MLTAGRSLISNVHITDNVICSDHFPLSFDIVCNIDPTFDCEFRKKKVNLPNWCTSSELDKSTCHICTNEELSKICIPTNALLCQQFNCTLNCKDIDVSYNDIILALKIPGTNCIPMSKSDKTSAFCLIAGYNEYVKEHYFIAQDALWWWMLYNKPKTGAIYHRMR